jgi:hypothetical protein
MIRRFETYAFLPGTPPPDQDRLATVLAQVGRYVPEVLHGAVGWNRSEAAARLVWEHAFASAETYGRYMVHPYHAELIDRYVLADSPERIVDTAKGAGLFGYPCADICPVVALPARRLLLLDIDPGTSAPRLDALFAALAAEERAGGAAATAWGPNTLATTWFDAVNPLPVPAPKWSHVFESGYPSLPTAARRPSLENLPVWRFRELRYELSAVDRVH